MKRESRLCRIRRKPLMRWNGRRSAIDGRTTRHRGLPEVGWHFTLAMAAYNLPRLPKLLVAAA
ncbi:MAG: hypothetical protein ING26_06405 [Roseomonas sp.]|nr:hypothetical protein [Roseomonas sp.]